jgi:hypothetical protein
VTEIVIVAHPKRRTMVKELIYYTGGHPIYDENEEGPSRNHVAALRLLASRQRHGYAVVLEDDVEVAPDFPQQLQAVLAVAPTAIVSLYLGTGYPAQWQDILRRSVNPIDADPHFLIAPEMLSMVGYAVRTDLLLPLATHIEYYAEQIGPDAAVSRFCRSRCLKVAYTRPSIVNHRDVEPIITKRFDGQPRIKMRRAWKFGSRKQWTSESMALDEPKLVSIDEHGGRWYEVEGERIYE